MRQMRDQGMKTILVSGDALVTDEYWQITGDAGEGTLMTFSPDPRKNPTPSRVVDDVQGRGHRRPRATCSTPTPPSRPGRRPPRRPARTDFDPVVAVLAGGTFKTVLGDVKFDTKGDVTLPGYVFYEWKNGKYDYLHEVVQRIRSATEKTPAATPGFFFGAPRAAPCARIVGIGRDGQSEACPARCPPRRVGTALRFAVPTLRCSPQQKLSPPRKPLLHSLPSPLAEGRLPEAFVGRSGERRLGFRLASGGLEARNPPAGESRPPTPCARPRVRERTCPPTAFLLSWERGTRRGSGSYGPGRQPHGAPPAHESGCGTGKPKTAAAGASTSALIRTTRRRSSSARHPSCLQEAREPGSKNPGGERDRCKTRLGCERGKENVCRDASRE